MSHYEVAEVEGDDHRDAVVAAIKKLEAGGYVPDEKKVSWKRVKREGGKPLFSAKVYALQK